MGRGWGPRKRSETDVEALPAEKEKKESRQASHVAVLFRLFTVNPFSVQAFSTDPLVRDKCPNAEGRGSKWALNKQLPVSFIDILVVISSHQVSVHWIRCSANNQKTNTGWDGQRVLGRI